MKLFLNDKTPVLTKEGIPTRHCPNTCCFYALYHSALTCYQFIPRQCCEGYSYILQNKVHDIFKL